MPRKTPSGPSLSPPFAGFNEAAARCRGKHMDADPLYVRPYEASMRPRPDAAENLRRGGDAAGRRRASMRPRPDAAENAGDARAAGATAAPGFNEAAARCRGKLVDQGEQRPLGVRGFNEAAARCRGKPIGGDGAATDTMLQ